MTAKCTPGQIFLWIGLVLGNLEYFTYIVWAVTAEFTSGTTQKACWIFIVTQPLWTLFVYTLYMGQHSDIRTGGERCKKLAAGPLFMLFMQSKLLPCADSVHHRFCVRFNTPDVKFNLMTLENLYRVQTFLELFLLTIPMMIVVSSVSNEIEWSLIARAAIIVAAVMFAKNLSIMTIFVIRKFIDGAEDPPMRPRTSKQKMSRVEMEAFNHIQSYLIEPHDDGMDDDGNTTVHQLMRYESDWFQFEAQLADLPHHLFMLNKFGQTPLDVAILETIAAVDIQAQKMRETKSKNAKRNLEQEQAEEEVENATEKAQMLILRMKKYTPDCSIKFVQKPHRLELMFEKSFAMAVKKNKDHILDLFPMDSIKTVYCSVHQLKDYKQYKEDKERHVELLTTPLHLACQNSNIEAVRQLIELQGYDVNVLLNEKNFVVELLQNSGYLDFSILNMIMKKKRPQINSGSILALNQAILRGNPFMINALLEHGEASPFVRDIHGKSPIHIAAAKLNKEIFEKLIRTTGADPMMPDADGNTFLHIMALGTIKDTEYDFIKQMVVRHGLRLTCNKEGKTPLALIKNNEGHQIALRGQPNFKRKIAVFFEERIAENPTFLDSFQEPVQHAAIRAGDLASLKQCVSAAGFKKGNVPKTVMDLLEQRDRYGQTCFFAAVKEDKKNIIDYLMGEEAFPNLDIFNCRDLEGDTPLHWAVRKGNHDLVSRLYSMRPEKCMQPNFKGQSPFFAAVQCQDMAALEIFVEYRYQALENKHRDYLGENPLFECARNGNEEIFNWFCGENQFFKARGQQNFKGQTIEHIVCINKQHPIVDEIRPRPDIVDYYGNLPLYYTLQNNDVPMLEKYFHSTREYFKLRNYKYETVFHICAKNNSLDALKQLLGRIVFISQLLKKDYVGNTPIHVAAKSGNLETLEFLCTACTPNFLKMQNDFGFTPLEAAQEKYHLMEESFSNKLAEAKTSAERAAFQEKAEAHRAKVQRIKDCTKFLIHFKDFVNEERWNERFDLPLNLYLTQVADTNMRIFLGMAKEEDKQIHEHRVPKTKVRREEPNVV